MEEIRAMEKKVILKKIQNNGVVGAGGAGFPTHVKLTGTAEIIIANGAECEPLLHKDKELLAADPQSVINGLLISAQLTSATTLVIALKKKAKSAISAVQKIIPKHISLTLLDDVYPAGDEFVLMHEVTGRIPSAGGLPINDGVLIQNIETLWWMAQDKPVTRKLLTVAGLVPAPCTIWVPIGSSIRDVLKFCGLEHPDSYGIIMGGAMMGLPIDDLDTPITKTTGGLIVLPLDHSLILRYNRRPDHIAKINKAACDQCCFCTQMCPRYLLGHPIEPHLVMRYRMMSNETTSVPEGARYCCSCNLCTLWSCPEDLFPAQETTRRRMELLAKSPSPVIPIQKTHPMNAYRKPSLSALKRRLGLSQYIDHAPLSSKIMAVSNVRIPLKQHVGIPSEPLVQTGDHVHLGQLIAQAPANSMGSNIHASIDGIVVSINDAITIENGE